MLYLFENLRYVATGLNLNICFFNHFIYIASEGTVPQNTEGAVHFKIKMSERKYLNTGLFMGNISLNYPCSQWRSRAPNIDAI